METEKKIFVEWIKEHKRELIVAGFSIVATVAVINCITNHKALERAWISIRKLIEKTPGVTPAVNTVSVSDVMPVKDIVEINIVTAGRVPHEVGEHLRNLPDRWKASAEKIATATEHGFNLLPGQTWVKSYRTGGIAA